MPKFFRALLFALLSVSVGAGAHAESSTNALSVAKAALRDGLWKLARFYAQKSDDPESLKITIESYARESKWDELITALPNDNELEYVRYYRAVALDERGESQSALELMSGKSFSQEEFKYLGALLCAKIHLANKNYVKAAQSLAGFLPKDAESMLLFAEVESKSGNTDSAEKFWRQAALSSAGASDRVRAAAAIKLKDESVINKVLETVSSQSEKDALSVALALVYLKRLGAGDFEEAEKILLSVVSREPDAAGAGEAYVTLAQKALQMDDASKAFKLSGEAMKIWPSLVRNYFARMVRGAALMKLGRPKDAVEDFSAALDAAETSDAKADALFSEANARFEFGDKTAAEKLYRRVVDEFPGTPTAKSLSQAMKIRALEEKGDGFYKTFRFKEAFDVYEEVLSNDASRKPAMRYRQALCLYSQGFDADAEQLMRQICTTDDALTHGRTALDACMWLAKYHYNISSFNESLGFFLKYAQSAADDNGRAYSYLWAAKAAFANRDYNQAIKIVSLLANLSQTNKYRTEAFFVQAESLMELARFDEAVLVLERLILFEKADSVARLKAQLRKADALFALGADNSARYAQALEAYKIVRQGESLDPSSRIVISYKIARTLDKLNLSEQALDRYYTEVLLPYREYRLQAINLNDEAKSAFSRAAFILADEYESRGRNFQAQHILELLATSDVPAASEAKRRIQLIKAKGAFL